MADPRDKRITDLLTVVDGARAALAFMAADEAEGSATDRTRQARIGMLRDTLNGVGDIEARRALGFLPDTIEHEPAGRTAIANRDGADEGGADARSSD